MGFPFFLTILQEFLDYVTGWIDFLVPYYTALMIFYVGVEVFSIKETSKPILVSPNLPIESIKTKPRKININMDFNGTYKLIQNVNTQAFLSAQGMGFVRRKLVDAADVVQAITIAPSSNDSNDTFLNQGVIAFHVHASVRGKGEVTKNVQYQINDRETKIMMQKETGLVFLDHISFLEDGRMKMVRTEESHKFQIVVYSHLENSKESENVIMVSESILTSKKGKVIKAKRIFRKIDETGQHLTNLEVPKTSLQTQPKVEPISNEFAHASTEQEQQKSPQILPLDDSNSSYAPIEAGTYGTIDPYYFISRIEAGDGMTVSKNLSQKILLVTIDKNILHIKTPNHLDVIVNLDQHNSESISPLRKVVGSAVFESVAIRTPNKQGEISVKRTCLYPSNEEMIDNDINEAKNEKEQLKEIFETYQWAENRQRLMVKTIIYFGNGETIESVQMMQRRP